MQKLSEVLKNRVAVEQRSGPTTPHQVTGLFYAKKLGAKSGSDYGSIIRCVKENASHAAAAYSFVADYPGARVPVRLFLWKYSQIKKQARLL